MKPNRARPHLRRYFKSDRGATAVEFALVLPIIVLLLIGCFEIPRFVLVYQRLARTSAGVADLVAQTDEPITPNQLADIFAAAKLMMAPYDIVGQGKIIVSSINNPSSGGGIKVTWQRDNTGTSGGTNPGSKIGAQGNTNPAIPTALRPASNEEVLAAEVYFQYQPVFSNLIYSGSRLYMISYTRPRNKNLMTGPLPWPPTNS